MLRLAGKLVTDDEFKRISGEAFRVLFTGYSKK